MNERISILGAACLAVAAALPGAGRAEADAAAAGCIAALRAQGGPEAAGGVEVLDRSRSEAGTLVTLRDASGTVWECLGYDDGRAEAPRAVDAAGDGSGLAGGAGAEDAGTTARVVVEFAPGAAAASYAGALTPGSTVRYVLDAREGQFLEVALTGDGPDLSYRIASPDGSDLLEMVGAGTAYEGQLRQSGDHMVEIVNRGAAETGYRVVFGIR